MGQPKTTIELNGKVYDATTGAIVGASQVIPTAPKAVDGFFRAPSTTPATVHPKPATAVKVTAAPAKPHKERSVHHTHRKPEHTKTLMRHVVKKPKISAPVVLPAKPAAPTVPKHDAVHTERQQRAASFSKSEAISRFSFHSSTPVTKKVAHLPVKPHPSHADVSASAGNLAISTAPVAPPIKLATAPGPSAQTSFSEALQNAQSHKQVRHKLKKSPRRRALNIASIALVVVLLTGFVAYQNKANLEVKLASNRAGFHANMPGYMPGGFGIAGTIQSSPGVVTINFHSHSDNRAFSLTQKPSDWTSDSLRQNFFTGGDTPMAYQDKGKTIYLYSNGTKAAWVNAGVLYQVSGNANLNSQQVFAIADSL